MNERHLDQLHDLRCTSCYGYLKFAYMLTKDQITPEGLYEVQKFSAECCGNIHEDSGFDPSSSLRRSLRVVSGD
jgi:hypothetical protein